MTWNAPPAVVSRTVKVSESPATSCVVSDCSQQMGSADPIRRTMWVMAQSGTASTIEGAGTYGAGLARVLRGQGLEVLEVDRPNRSNRRLKGGSRRRGDSYFQEPVRRSRGQAHCLGCQAVSAPQDTRFELDWPVVPVDATTASSSQLSTLPITGIQTIGFSCPRQFDTVFPHSLSHVSVCPGRSVSVQ